VSGYRSRMSDQDSDRDRTDGRDDEVLPEDLRPSDDNPLAKPLTEDEPTSPEEVERLDMQCGKEPEQESED
jgi:hypothetical protein